MTPELVLLKLNFMVKEINHFCILLSILFEGNRSSGLVYNQIDRDCLVIRHVGLTFMNTGYV
jgi:hypothetical protein